MNGSMLLDTLVCGLCIVAGVLGAFLVFYWPFLGHSLF